MTRGSESWFVALVLLVFVGAGIWLLFFSREDSNKVFPPYSTYSPRPQGLQAFFELLEASGAEPQRGVETIYDYPHNACVVMATEFVPDASMFFGSMVDVRALRLWLEDGGRLLLICDREMPLIDELFFEELQFDHLPEYYPPPGGLARRVSGGQNGQISALSRVYKPGEVYELDGSPALLWAELGKLELAAPYGHLNPALEPLLGSYDPNFSNPTLDPLVLRSNVGSGEVIWLTTPEMLTNRWIARQDNHRLGLALASLATRPLTEDGPRLKLQFDERIHGYGREGFNLVSLLTRSTGGRLLLAVAALCIVLFLGASIRPARFHPLLVPRRRQATEMVHAQADLYRRAGARFSLAESLVDGLKRAYAHSRHSGGMPSDRALLLWLEEQRIDEPALADFLRSKILPPVPRRLLELAQACDRLRTKLEQGIV